MKVYAATKKGKHGSNNDDRCLIGYTILADGEYSINLKKGIIAIADGVGGNNAGYVASQFVCHEISLADTISSDILAGINKKLIERSMENISWQGMATTLSGILFDNEYNILFHVGNTRIYAVKAGAYLNQLTNDDTTVNYLVKSGKLTEEDAENYHSKNEINACFGGGGESLLKVKISNVNAVNDFLFTTDGVHETLSIDDMEDILEKTSDKGDICKSMIIKAIELGSEDDCTVIYIDNSEV